MSSSIDDRPPLSPQDYRDVLRPEVWERLSAVAPDVYGTNDNTTEGTSK